MGRGQEEIVYRLSGEFGRRKSSSDGCTSFCNNLLQNAGVLRIATGLFVGGYSRLEVQEVNL